MAGSHLPSLSVKGITPTDVRASPTTPTTPTAFAPKSNLLSSVDALLTDLDSCIRDLQLQEDDPTDHRLQTRSQPPPARTNSSDPTWDARRCNSVPTSVIANYQFQQNTIPTFTTLTPSTHSGFLRKLTTTRSPLTPTKTWKPRFLVLTDTHLFLFRTASPHDRSITGLPITPSTVAYVSAAGLWILEVKSQGVNPETNVLASRTWHLQCANKDEMVAWLAVLRSAIDRSKLRDSITKEQDWERSNECTRGILLSTLLDQHRVEHLDSHNATTSLTNPHIQPALAILEDLERLHSSQSQEPTPPPTPDLSSPAPKPLERADSGVCVEDDKDKESINEKPEKKGKEKSKEKGKEEWKGLTFGMSFM